MSWKRLTLNSRPAKTQSRLHLDESVPASVERLLVELGYRFSTSKAQGLMGHSDVDQAAFCWRERRTLLTFDWDFFGMEELPYHRTPGIVVIDCDRRRAKDISRAIDTLARFEHTIGAVQRGTHVVVRADGHVGVWTGPNLRMPPAFRYRFDEQFRPLVWRP